MFSIYDINEVLLKRWSLVNNLDKKPRTRHIYHFMEMKSLWLIRFLIVCIFL